MQRLALAVAMTSVRIGEKHVQEFVIQLIGKATVGQKQVKTLHVTHLLPVAMKNLMKCASIQILVGHQAIFALTLHPGLNSCSAG